MNDSNPPRLERRFRLRMPLVFTLSVFLGCRPSNEQKAVDAFSRDNAHYHKGELDMRYDSYNLAAAYAAKGDNAQARRWQQKAMEISGPPDEDEKD